MRSIKLRPIVIFHFLLILAGTLGIASTIWTVGKLPLGSFRPVVVVMGAALFVFVYAILFYRCFLRICPLTEGSILPGSRQEFIYQVHLLFDLIVFSPILASRLIPVPLLRLIYIALGAHLGQNTYTSGIICDPIFVTVGANCILGQDSLLIPHALEGSRLAHRPIHMGDNVTIGAHAVILNGVTVENDAIVATGAVVPKGTHIGTGEIWGGVPAKRIQKHDPEVQHE
jgi:hypothetical protein